LFVFADDEISICLFGRIGESLFPLGSRAAGSAKGAIEGPGHREKLAGSRHGRRKRADVQEATRQMLVALERENWWKEP